MATKFYINLNYVCNERCTFCASDLTHNFRVDGRSPFVTLAELREWAGAAPPAPGDKVMLAGGEPTLHREFLPIVSFFAERCHDLLLFTNGLRLADADFARRAVEAGVTRFEIALFGATAERHDAVTRVPGSFERTLAALNTLNALKGTHDFQVEVRLLVSRETLPENPRIVEVLCERARGVDAVSLNRLILSDNARRAGSAVSWEEARPSVNAAAELILRHGFELRFQSVPLCVFEGSNAVFVRDAVLRQFKRVVTGREPAAWELRYFDPVLAAGEQLEGTSEGPPAEPREPCVSCDYLPRCGRVEQWYADAFGVSGLRAVRVPDLA